MVLRRRPAPEATPRGEGAGPLIRLDGVEKTYRSGVLEYQAVRGIDLGVDRGEMVAVVGPSGSGKSTVLNLITGIDRPTAGTVTVDGHDLGEMSEDDLARWRGQAVGIVFQFFQLLPTLTALENTMLPMEFARRGDGSTREAAAREKLALVGLTDKADRFPSELSGGEQQRVAIARAMACDPLLIVADEPTGNLDSETAASVLEVLRAVNATGTTVVFVTHDRRLAEQASRMVTILDGRVASP